VEEFGKRNAPDSLGDKTECECGGVWTFGLIFVSLVKGGLRSIFEDEEGKFSWKVA